MIIYRVYRTECRIDFNYQKINIGYYAKELDAICKAKKSARELDLHKIAISTNTYNTNYVDEGGHETGFPFDGVVVDQVIVID